MILSLVVLPATIAATSLEVWNAREGVIYGSTAYLRVDRSPVCIRWNGDEACAEGHELTVTGFLPGTHEIALGEQTLLIDALPEGDDQPVLSQEDVILGHIDDRYRKLCILTNSMAEHSQNRIFQTVSDGLNPRRWAIEWFVPEDHPNVTRVDGLDELDWQLARKVRVTSTGRSPCRGWLERHDLRFDECDVVWYANTFDDPSVAAMAELVSFASPRALRVMDLPNIPVPPNVAADIFVAPSHFAKRSVHGKVAVIAPAAFDGPLLPRRRQRKTFIVAYLGRLAPERSPGLFVRAIAKLRRDARFRIETRFPGEIDSEKPAVRAVCVGDGPLRSSLETLSRRIGAAVRFLGAIPRTKVPEFLASVDVLLQPRPRGETFGVANAEATVYGAHVIAYLHSGAAESAPGATLLTSLHPDDYATALADHLFDNKNTTDDDFERQTIIDRFSRSRLVDSYDRLFSSPHRPLVLGISDGAAYAGPLVAGALSLNQRVAVVPLTSAMDVGLVGCLDGGCAESWTPECVAIARHLRAQALENGATRVILVCGEPWDLTEAGRDFDAVLSTTTTRLEEKNHLYLPVAATAFAELQMAPEILLSSSTERYENERHGVAYLYYRCRPHRETFFDALVKKDLDVAALGACRGEDTSPSKRFAEDWHRDAVELYQKFKFVVAFENTATPGYVTEKLALAFLAGAVPIYWGHSDSATMIFNASAFIDCSLYSSLDACADEVRRIDNDPLSYDAMRSVTPLVGNGLEILRATDLVGLRDLLGFSTEMEPKLPGRPPEHRNGTKKYWSN